jgi:hypothetical protein
LSLETQVIGLPTFVGTLHGADVGRVTGHPLVLALLRVNIRVIVSVPRRFLVSLIDFDAAEVIVALLVFVLVVDLILRGFRSVLVVFLLRVFVPRGFLLWGGLPLSSLTDASAWAGLTWLQGMLGSLEGVKFHEMPELLDKKAAEAVYHWFHLGWFPGLQENKELLSIDIWGCVLCDLKDQVKHVMVEGRICQVWLRGVQGSEEASFDQIESLLKLIY